MPSMFDALGRDHQEVKRMLNELEADPAGHLTAQASSATGPARLAGFPPGGRVRPAPR